jgi:ABC-type transport system involved in multi-copper enzyme maturation permease subunit
VFATPRHGVRIQANFTTDIAGGAGGAPRWLRLRRSGATITGYESADGRAWREVGTVELPALPRRVEVGIFVASPNTRMIEQVNRDGLYIVEGGSEASTIGTATFDHVRLEAQGSEQPVVLTGEPIGSPADNGDTSERAGTFTITGSGDFGLFDDGFDITQMSLAGVSFMLVLIIVLGVRFITAEYQDGMIRTTFAASPRRGRVLAAKALVVGVTAFVTALVAGAVAFHLAQPRLYANGFAPAGTPFLSLTGGPVLRAVVGSAALIALWAVLSLSLGTILRRTGVAVAAALALLIIPSMVGFYLPLGMDVWLRRLSPLAGFAILKTIVRYDDVIAPFGGLGVLAAYTSAAFVVALWRLRTRDV